jgi:hypothetical protein
LTDRQRALCPNRFSGIPAPTNQKRPDACVQQAMIVISMDI